MKTAKRYWRKFSWFAFACSLVAVSYIGYRVYLVAGPNGLEGILGSEGVAAVSIGCKHDDSLIESPSKEKYPIITATYQDMIRNTTHLSKNLVVNADLEQAPDNAPTNFFHVTEGEGIDYAYLRDNGTQMPFLRAVNAKETKGDALSGGWIMNSVAIDKDSTYAYGFEYRSTVPVLVTLEMTMPDGSIEYANVTELKKNKEWQHFTAHIHNLKGAKAMRVVAISHKAGWVDTRSYDIHRIPNETLKQGIVSITFDDGWQSIKDKAMPILDDYGYQTTQYIISDAATKTVDEYMNLETVKAIKAKGHEIGSHTTKHCDLTKLSAQDADEQVKDSKSELEKADLGPVTSLAYPYGQYDENIELATGKYYPLMRSSDAGYNDRYFDSRNIRSMVITDKTTEEEVASWVKYAEEHKLWLVMVYHRVDEHGEYNVTSKNLIRQLDVIKNSSLKVMTLGEAADSIR
jgi:peptidoglycan/xylan/chitin deacetylase (PgdA/CDA1 family)